MKIILLIFIVSSQLLLPTNSLTLQGQWTLLSVPNMNLNIPTNISIIVYRSQQIINAIQFSTCQSLSYQFNVQDDNFYVNIETEFLQPIQQCTLQENNQITSIRTYIRQVLKFIIQIDQLILMDPSEDVLFTFIRTQNASYEAWQTQIVGSWMVQMSGEASTSYVMIANNTQFSICSGATFNYKITALYQIKVALQSQGACSDQTLINNTKNITYYRKFDNNLEFYDNQINLLFQAIFNPNGITAIPKAPANVVKSAPLNTTPTPTSGLPAGKYFLLLLFNRSLGRIPVTITSSTIAIQLCSQLVFAYSILSSSSIKVQSSTAPNISCSKANETLYYNYMVSSVGFTDNLGIITLIDSNSRQIVSLNTQ